MSFRLNDKEVAQGIKQTNTVYRIFFRAKAPDMKEVNSAVMDTKTWHERLGNINLRAMKDLISRDLAHGVKVKQAEEFCEDCQFSKSHKLPFKKEVEKKRNPEKWCTQTCAVL